MQAEPKYATAVLFGGSGFIGTHIARYLLEHGIAGLVILADIAAPPRTDEPRITWFNVDVRRPIPLDLFPSAPDLVINLAAVHREPGHQAQEYFATNVSGAEHICAYATAVQCNSVIFASSISVYGPGNDERDEESLPVPASPYGASKLVAEKVHLAWQQQAPGRRLLIVRPGVVFGPGEAGNVTRLVKAVTGKYFVFFGNHEIRKAGGYVLELCRSLMWTLEQMRERDIGNLTFNFTIDPAPRLDEFVTAVAGAAGIEPRMLSVPYSPVLALFHLAHLASRLIGIEHPLHPVRARKLIASNHIAPLVLRRLGYQPAFSLSSAMQHWRTTHPGDWRVK